MMGAAKLLLFHWVLSFGFDIFHISFPSQPEYHLANIAADIQFISIENISFISLYGVLEQDPLG
jgi:hypothetical protein